MNKKLTLTRDDHRAIGLVLKRMDRDLVALLCILDRAYARNSKMFRRAIAAQRAILDLRSNLDSAACQLWTEGETQEFFRVYFGPSERTASLGAIAERMLGRKESA
jgi:hypothetical protein